MTDWGVLDGGASVPAAPEATTAPGWGRPDGGVVRQRVAAFAPGVPVPPPLDIPPPEATASLLRAGEHLWAKVDRQGGAVLGSGQRLRLPDGVPDDFYGWRRVQIVEPAVLSASVLPIPWDELAVGAGDDPAGLYHPEPVLPAGAPQRVRPFPVAAGPDLERLFEDRVVESVQEQRDHAAQAERAADQRAAEAERAADQRAAQAERAADQRVELAERAAAAQSAVAEQRAQDRVRIAENRATAVREHGEAVERWAAEVQRAAQREIAEAQARAAEADATVARRSAEATRKAAQQIEAGRQAVQSELSEQWERVERLRRTVAVLAAVAGLISLVAVVLGWLAFGSTA